MTTITLDAGQMRRINWFANERMKNVTRYRGRGGVKREDIIIGAMGEYGVHKYLCDLGLKPSNINLTIQCNKDKSYDPDFILKDEKRIHVKSQSLISKDLYGSSYLMQKSDPLIITPFENDFLILTTCDIFNQEVEILGVFNMYNILAYNGVKEPKLDHLKKNKVAIYLDDIISLDYNLSLECFNV